MPQIRFNCPESAGFGLNESGLNSWWSRQPPRGSGLWLPVGLACWS